MSHLPTLREIDYQAITRPDAREEIAQTIADLCESFGRESVLECLTASGLIDENASIIKTLDILRGYTALIFESRRPRLVAALVGRLVGLEFAAGKSLTLEQIGKRHGLSKQAVSKRLALLADRLSLARPMCAKSRLSHRLMNRRNYAA